MLRNAGKRLFLVFRFNSKLSASAFNFSWFPSVLTAVFLALVAMSAAGEPAHAISFIIFSLLMVLLVVFMMALLETTVLLWLSVQCFDFYYLMFWNTMLLISSVLQALHQVCGQLSIFSVVSTLCGIYLVLIGSCSCWLVIFLFITPGWHRSWIRLVTRCKFLCATSRHRYWRLR